ncbi:P-loop containing nucleoside triphosphate hydrolase protein [Crassisporium funariophilum]|nr:P-loop containing nucleoside triphosphate hydrolase protein [Crassisporium funariophilum]
MTMWDKVAISKGEARELELIDNYWSQMIKSGSTYARFVNNAKSAWEITNPIIKKSQQGNRRIDRKSLLPRSQAKTVNAESLSKDDVIIAVMGPTGSGKSTFINIVAGLASGITTGAGDTLESCTSTINIVKLSFPEYSECNIVFVDTPGFDDTNKSDVEILRMIADWLKKRYQANILLSGLVYFHRISDNRMSGTPVKNLEMFKALSGKKMLTNIVLATTMWDEVDEKTGTDREEELKTKYWKAMVDHGSSTRRFYGTRESALSLLAPLIDEANAKQLVLLQTEMVDLGKKLQSTSAGQALYSKLDMLVKHRQDVVRRMREEMKRASQDLTLIDLLREEYGNLKRQLHSTLDDMQRMKLPIGQRLLRAITRAFTGKDIEAE